MNQWEIYTWDGHPAVIVSHPLRVARKESVNVMSCTTHRGVRRPEPHEVVLDRADGLEWEPLCRCDILYAVEKKHLNERRGIVTPLRRQSIIACAIATLGWQRP